MTETARPTLADLRRFKGMSQSDVGRRMGVGKQRVSQIERDFPHVRFSVVQAYLNAIGRIIELTDPSCPDVRADKIACDPRGPRDHGDRTRVRAEKN